MLTAIDHSFGISWTHDLIARCQPSGSAAQAESLNFSGDGFRQILDELYPARIFVRGQFALYMILQLKAKLGTGFKLALQQHDLSDDGIKKGDVLIIDTKSEPSAGDIVMVLYDTHVLLRYYYPNQETGEINLKGNTTFIEKSSFRKEEIRIIGRLSAKLTNY
jgi:hypothetical protein